MKDLQSPSVVHNSRKNTQLGIVISKRLVTPDQIEPRWEARYVYFLYR